MGRRSSWSPLAGVLALLAVLIVPAAATAYEEPEPRAEDATTRQEYVPGQLIVRFDPGASQGERADARRRNDLEKISDLPVADTELVRFRGQGTPPERARQAQGDNAVRVAEPNFLYHPATTDPEYGQLWGLENTGQPIGYDAGDPGTTDADIDAPEGWAAATSGGAVVVGVIDTGVQISHPDLKDRIVLNGGEIGDPADSDGNGVITIADLSPDLPADDLNGNGFFDPEDVVLGHTEGTDDDGNGYVDDVAGYHFYTDTDPQSDNHVYDPYERDAHGTHVSGTIAGTPDNGQGVAGVAPDAYILPIKFLGAEGGATSDAVRALDFAYTHGATLTNNSWGGGGASATLEQKIAEGPLFVAAAGNDGTNADSHYPSAYDLDNIVSVASTTNDDTLSSFSNYSSTSVDLGAPGSNILSSVPEYTKAVIHDGSDYYSALHSIGLEGIRSSTDRVALVEAALQRAGLAEGDSILLVDDDGGDGYETVWIDTLASLGLSPSVHTVPDKGNPALRNGPSAAEMDGHDLVVWFTGADFSSTLTGTDRSELSTYLDSDGTTEKLLLFGVDIAYDLDNNQSGPSTFLQDVLHTDFVGDIDYAYRVKGAPGSTGYADVPSPIDLEPGDAYPGHYFSDRLQPINGGEAALLSHGYNWYSGTSMATPHVSGAAAVLYGENPALTVAEVKEALMLGGDPFAALDGTTVSGNRLNLSGSVAYIPDACGPDANEPNDGSGSATPLISDEPVNGEICPTGDEDWFSIEAQAGDTITADLTYDSSAGDLNIELYGPDGEGGLTLLDSSGGSSNGHESVSGSALTSGAHVLRLVGHANAYALSARSQSWTQAPQGDWVGSYGSDGWLLAGWEGSSDLGALPGVSMALEQGSRYRWSSSTGAVRALEAADESTRRAATFYDNNELRLRLDFAEAYSGTLRLYALDWSSTSRRQSVVVDDGRGPQTVSLDAPFDQGAWMAFPVQVAAGGSVTITATRTGGYNAVIAGIFLGEGPPAQSWTQAPQGDWVGSYGSDGWLLAGWEGSSDLGALPGVSMALEQGSRYRWSSSTGAVRALEAADESTRRAATFYDNNELRLRLDFAEAYSGTLRLYALDWSSTSRRQSVVVDDGRGPQTVSLDAPFDQGAWMAFPVQVAAGGSVTITATRTGGYNAVIAGIFLGEGPPAQSWTQAPQGDWVGSYGSDGWLLAGWEGSSDLGALPGVSMALEQGSRYRWSSSTGAVRALEAADESTRRAATFYDNNELRLRLDFAEAYSGTLRLYALDWSSTSRRQSVVVDDGRGPQTVSLDAPFDQGAWMAFPVQVAAGGSVTITATRTGGYNAVIAGIFLGEGPTPAEL